MNRSLVVLALALSTATAAENAKQAKPEAASTALYQVQDGNKVDAKTLAGWKTWRALACERCHGAEQEDAHWLLRRAETGARDAYVLGGILGEVPLRPPLEQHGAERRAVDVALADDEHREHVAIHRVTFLVAAGPRPLHG